MSIPTYNQSPPANDLPPAQAAKLWKAARDFEAMTLGQLLQPMFDTVDTTEGPFGGGEAEKAWKPMLVEAIGKAMEIRGGLGLAVPVFHALLQAQEGRR
ncbi:MAG: rod-binding protein [Acetobacteraceae bacterium]|nr:rod-binding protein [Acetobacteraceae bacterium]